MIGVLAQLMGSRFGRRVAMALVAVAVAAIAFWRVYAAGRGAERSKATQASLEALRKRMKTDDEIARLPPSERRARLREWMRAAPDV